MLPVLPGKSRMLATIRACGVWYPWPDSNRQSTHFKGVAMPFRYTGFFSKKNIPTANGPVVQAIVNCSLTPAC